MVKDAAPNGSPTKPQPAHLIAEGATVVTATSMPAEDFQLDLRAKRDENDATVPVSSLTVHNTFTSLSSKMTLPGIIQNATSTTFTSITSAVSGMATGEFTGADGGIYGVTSESGYIVIDGKTLSPGQGALIGNGVVTDEGTGGLVANGQTVPLSSASTKAVVTTASSASVSSTVSPTTSSASASAAASSSSSAAAAVPTVGNEWMAAAGGLFGLMVLWR